MLIADKHVVSIHYTLKGEDGTTLDSSEGKAPLVYLHGTKNIIPGLENALTGKRTGDKIQVTIQPEDAYGPLDKSLIKILPHTAFDGLENVQPGMQFEAKGEDGQTQLITVQALEAQGVLIDGNHPMAGKVLNFDIFVEEVREASEEELSHGHAHEQGC